MISRRLKATFFTCFGPAMWLNGCLYRACRAPKKGTVRVQLGPGQKNYLAGWINVDANFLTAKCDVWADLRNHLPFRDGTVDAFYSHHVVEHLPDALLSFHFRELYRCLKPGGVFRVGTNGDSAMRKYIEGDFMWFDDFPDKRGSIGGRLVNFLLCRNEHLTILTHSYLQEIARAGGFPDVTPRKPVHETGFPQWFGAQVMASEWESTPDMPHTLLVEGQEAPRLMRR